MTTKTLNSSLVAADKKPKCDCCVLTFGFLPTPPFPLSLSGGRICYPDGGGGGDGKLIFYTRGTHLSTGLPYKAVPRLQECCKEVEAEVVGNSRNTIFETWERPYRGAL